MRKLLFVIFIFSVTITNSFSVTYREVRSELKSYYKKKALESVEQILPKGHYNIRVDIKLSKKKVRKYNKTSRNSKSKNTQKIKLPLGGSYIKVDSESNGLNKDVVKYLAQSKVNLSTYLSFVRNVSVHIAYSEKVSENLKSYTEQFLIKDLGLRIRKGDSIKNTVLPKSAVDLWANKDGSEFEPNGTRSPSGKEAFAIPEFLKRWGPFKDLNHKSFMANFLTYGLMVLSFLFVGAVFLGFFTFFRFSNKMNNQFSQIISQIKNTAEAFLESSHESSLVKNPEEHKEKGQFEKLSIQNANERKDYFHHLDQLQIKAFLFDLLSDQKNMNYAFQLYHRYLSHDQIDFLNQFLPTSFINYHGNTKELVDVNILIDLFENNFFDYHLVQKDCLKEKLLKYPVTQINNIIEEFLASQQIEEIQVAAIFLNELTHTKREIVIEGLSTQNKINLLSKYEEIDVSQENYVAKCNQLIGKLPKAELIDIAEETHFNQNVEKFFYPVSFKEDEEFFTNDVYHKLSYDSVLSIFDKWNSEQWESVPVKDLAWAFHGYSEKIIQKVKAKLSDKRLEWFENYFGKTKTQPLDFKDNIVISSQSVIINLIKNDDKSSADEGNNKKIDKSVA